MTLPIIDMPGKRSYPPRQSDFTIKFWQGLGDGIFQTTRCVKCEKLSFPPKPICPHCWSKETVWETLSGKGTLYSKTTVYAGPAVFKEELPYQVGIVDLDENIRIATRVLGDAKLDAQVKMVILKYEDGYLYAAR